MMTKKITKTRFAPSPTGFTHIGNLRTALFSWLYAKKMNGKFFLRIDDTDHERVSKIYINNIFDTLKWLGLYINEKIIFQSANYDIYKDFINILLKKKFAYKCFCSKERLLLLKEKQIKEKKNIRYDEFCKNITLPKKCNEFVIRFNNTKDGYTEFFDNVKGKISIANIEMDDFIIAKNNYNPTYNFASTVDDITLGITDIIRGEDHISNTPKQIQIIKSLNADIPSFTHLPLILNKDKTVLSKRNNDVSINFYKENGILPDALLNYLIRLGWSYKNKEIFSIKEMINLFDIKNINKSSIIIDKEKLLWLNRYYIKNCNTNYLFKNLLYIEKKFSINYKFGPSIKKLIEFSKIRVSTIKEIITKNINIYCENVNIDDTLLKKYFSNIIFHCLYDLYKEFKNLNYIWTISNIESSITYIVKNYNIKLWEIAIPLRIIIFGRNEASPIYEVILITGRLLILKKILNIIKKTGAIAQLG